jgi:probable F420-dependent oxidoreductase
VRFGISLPQIGRLAGVAAVRRVATHAEQAGYASVWVRDGFVPTGTRTPGLLDPLGALHVAAATTERIRLGTSVLVGPWYPPVLLARALTTLDHASAGRLTVGLGLGEARDHYAAVGVSDRHLATRFDELLDVLGAMWCDDPVHHSGPRLQFGPVAVQPKTVQRPRPPILLAAHTPAGLDRIARVGDGWTVAGLNVEAIASMWRALREMTTGYGRDPDTLQLVVRADVALSGTPLGDDRSSFSGTREQIAADLDATRALGAHEVVLGFRDDVESVDELIAGYDTLAVVSGVAPASV